MRRWGLREVLIAVLLVATAATGCGKRSIDATTELAGAVHWYSGVSAEQLLAAIRQMFQAAGYPVATVDQETGQIETGWTPEFQGSMHGWRLTRWSERQKFIALVARSQLQTEKGEPLVTVLLRLRWEERPPGGAWHIKEEGGAPSQSPVFQRLVRELDERAAKLGARRN